MNETQVRKRLWKTIVLVTIILCIGVYAMEWVSTNESPRYTAQLKGVQLDGDEYLLLIDDWDPASGQQKTLMRADGTVLLSGRFSQIEVVYADERMPIIQYTESSRNSDVAVDHIYTVVNGELAELALPEGFAGNNFVKHISRSPDKRYLLLQGGKKRAIYLYDTETQVWEALSDQFSDELVQEYNGWFAWWDTREQHQLVIGFKKRISNTELSEDLLQLAYAPETKQIGERALDTESEHIKKTENTSTQMVWNSSQLRPPSGFSFPYLFEYDADLVLNDTLTPHLNSTKKEKMKHTISWISGWAGAYPRLLLLDEERLVLTDLDGDMGIFDVETGQFAHLYTLRPQESREFSNASVEVIPWE